MMLSLVVVCLVAGLGRAMEDWEGSQAQGWQETGGLWREEAVFLNPEETQAGPR